jgi:hypothetical protein
MFWAGIGLSIFFLTWSISSKMCLGPDQARFFSEPDQARFAQV